MQKQLISGDSLSLTDSYADYLASDGWTLKIRLTPQFVGTAIVLTAVADVDNFLTSVGASITAAWAPGIYSYSKWVEKGTQRITVETGATQVLADPATATIGADNRSHLEKTIANIEAMIEGRATKDVQEYTIADRQLKHIPINELLIWRDKYKAQLAAERAAKSLTKGTGLGRKILVRL
jgi:hypothetical protein